MPTILTTIRDEAALLYGALENTKEAPTKLVRDRIGALHDRALAIEIQFVPVSIISIQGIIEGKQLTDEEKKELTGAVEYSVRLKEQLQQAASPPVPA